MKSLFSEREIRAVAVFLPLAALVVLGIFLVRPKADVQTAQLIRTELDEPLDSARLKAFDPNEADYDQLRSLGLTTTQAVGLLRYRAAGKVFRIPEDVALCYEIDDSLYHRLAPYIRIGRKYAVSPRWYRTERIVAEPIEPVPFLLDTVSARYLCAIGAFSMGQAKAVVNWVKLTHVYDMTDFRRCYMVSDSIAAALEPYLIFEQRKPKPWEVPVELNSADSATLRGVAGIGEKTVGRILEYRERLGGFVRVEQLAEVPGVTESNYEKMVLQITCDSCGVQKIDINSASPNVLARHPYLTPPTLRKLLKARQLNGGWTCVEELIDDNILKPQEAARLTPYLVFGTQCDSVGM